MKIHWAIKLAAFVASVVTLSWFFAGWRMINESPALISWATLLGGTLSTLLLLGLQGYWIYFDEKSKGTLKKRIQLFEKIYAMLESRCQNQQVSNGQHCCAKEG